ncbi:MAG: RadC family protein [Patescibacteria group bacterium]
MPVSSSTNFNQNLRCLRYGPREKLQKFGLHNLTNVDLLSLIINSGSKNLSVKKLAEKILRTWRLSELTQLNISKLTNIPGIGKTKAGALLATIELAKRISQADDPTTVSHPKTVYQLTREITSKKREYLIAFFLNGRNQLLNQQIISIGNLNQNLVEPRDIFIPALNSAAAFIILAHNHPSGDPNPSENDLLATQHFVEAGMIIGIELIDHLVVCENNYYSMREHGQIRLPAK